MEIRQRQMVVHLVELAGAAVGARGLVAEARRDLEVAVEARDHEDTMVRVRTRHMA